MSKKGNFSQLLGPEYQFHNKASESAVLGILYLFPANLLNEINKLALMFSTVEANLIV